MDEPCSCLRATVEAFIAGGVIVGAAVVAFLWHKGWLQRRP